MRVVVCPDSFKGTMSAREAAEAIRRGVIAAAPDAEVDIVPLGDGGEGTVGALAAALPEVTAVECGAVDALRRPIRAAYVISGGTTALVESAAASGLTLISPGERDIMRADTFGTGLLMADAWRRGIRDFIVGMGGTATCDGGYGAYLALRQHAPAALEGANGRFTLLCDVDNPLCGPKGAAKVFGPQKGATPAQTEALDLLLRERAREYSRLKGIDTTCMAHAGAAGGLAAMMMACLGAEAVSGIERVLDLLRFDHILRGADLVITGEGKADATTLRGKTPSGVLRRASRLGIPVALLCGRVEHAGQLLSAGFSHVARATPARPEPHMSHAACLEEAARKLIRSMRP